MREPECELAEQFSELDEEFSGPEPAEEFSDPEPAEEFSVHLEKLASAVEPSRPPAAAAVASAASVAAAFVEPSAAQQQQQRHDPYRRPASASGRGGAPISIRWAAAAKENADTTRKRHDT